MKTALYELGRGTQNVVVAYVRNSKARRYILRFQDGVLRVTVPRAGTLRHAQEFVCKNDAWIEKQMRRAPAHWSDGTEILFRGARVALRLTESDGRGVSSGAAVAIFTDQVVPLDSADIRIAVEARMRTIATKELTARTWELAREQGVEVGGVTVRSQRSRWGSCSVRKRISLNWRLIQAPSPVRDYIIIHELMHLKEMNHSARFWAHVENAFPDYREAESWLRKNSALLK